MTKFEYGRMNNTKFDKINNDKKGNCQLKENPMAFQVSIERSRTGKRFN